MTYMRMPHAGVSPLTFSLTFLGVLVVRNVVVCCPVAAQAQYIVKPIAKKIKQLPQGPLYWQVENFPTLGIQAAVGPDAAGAQHRTI